MQKCAQRLEFSEPVKPTKNAFIERFNQIYRTDIQR
ncbi:integrase core domain-containing protein [Pantoea allii]